MLTGKLTLDVSNVQIHELLADNFWIAENINFNKKIGDTIGYSIRWSVINKYTDKKMTYGTSILSLDESSILNHNTNLLKAMYQLTESITSSYDYEYKNEKKRTFPVDEIINNSIQTKEGVK